jgi:glutamate-1-semialdehyde aminotransferase
VEAAFTSEGMTARCTGDPNSVIPGSSVGAVLFPYKKDAVFRSPEETKNPEYSDVEMSEKVLRLALLLEDVHVMHGLGSVSTAHTESDIARLGDACVGAARRIKGRTTRWA